MLFNCIRWYEMKSNRNSTVQTWSTQTGFVLSVFYSGSSWATSPATTTSGINSFYLLKLLLALLCVLAIFLVLAKVVRQMNGMSGSPSGPLAIVASLSVGTRERILIVEVGEDQLLVGVSPAGIVKLHDLDKPVNLENETTSSTFKTQLNNILGDRVN